MLSPSHVRLRKLPCDIRILSRVYKNRVQPDKGLLKTGFFSGSRSSQIEQEFRTELHTDQRKGNNRHHKINSKAVSGSGPTVGKGDRNREESWKHCTSGTTHFFNKCLLSSSSLCLGTEPNKTKVLPSRRFQTFGAPPQVPGLWWKTYNFQSSVVWSPRMQTL